MICENVRQQEFTLVEIGLLKISLALTHPLSLRIREKDDREGEHHAEGEEDEGPAVHSTQHREGGVLGRKAYAHREDVGDCVAAGAETGGVDFGREHVNNWMKRQCDRLDWCGETEEETYQVRKT